jgi:large subunit ribosomal protein L25
MNEQREITVQARHTHGKGKARKLRVSGLIPAIVYGAGGEHRSISVDPRILRKTMDPARKLNTWYKVTIEDDGKPVATESCIVVDHQIHKVKDAILHVDFLRVDPTKELTVRIPVEVSGRAAGVVAGGSLKTFLRYVHVSVKPSDIPASLVVDITPLQSGETLRIKDLSIPGGRILENGNQSLAHIEPAKIKIEEETDDKKKKAAPAKAAAKPAAAAAPKAAAAAPKAAPKKK